MIVRFLREGEEEACNDFHNRHYGHRRTLAQWRWEFIPSTFKYPPIPFVVVEDNGRIVGTQAFIPVQMIDEDGVYWTAKSEETLVDPAYRGRDLSVKMYQLLFDWAEQNEIARVWGFTTATKALRRSGFVVPCVTSQLFRPFSTRSVPVMLGHEAQVRGSEGSRVGLKQFVAQLGCAGAQVISGARFAVTGKGHWAEGRDGVREIRTLSAPPLDSGSLCERFIRQWGGATIYRDSHYLRWRLFENPWVRSIVLGAYIDGQLQGWIAFGMGDDGVACMVDLMVVTDESRPSPPDDLVRALLAEAVLRSRAMGAIGIRGWRVNDHPLDRLVTKVARSMGFYHLKRGGPMVVYSTAYGQRRKPVDRSDAWYVTRIYTEGLLG